MITDWYHPDALAFSTRYPVAKTKPWEVAWLLWKLSLTPGNILEVGAHYGETTREFALAYPDRLVYAVDYPGNPTLSVEQLQDLPPSAKAVEAARDLPNVRVLLQDSRSLDYSTLPDIGFVFIDGDHSFDGVRADSELAFAHFARHPGTVAWHDCYPHEHIAVHAYLSMLSQKWPGRVKMVIGTTLAYIGFAA